MKLDSKVEKFLKGKLIAKVATINKDGSPHVTPIWYMYDHGHLIINTTRQRVKYRNIVRDPRVSFLIDDGYPYVVFFGKARIAEERDAQEDIKTLAIRYHGEARGKKMSRDHFSKMDRVTIEIIPERIFVDL